MLAKARLQSGNIDMMCIASALVGDRGGHTCRLSHAGADRHNADGGMRGGSRVNNTKKKRRYADTDCVESIGGSLGTYENSKGYESRYDC